MLSVLLYFIFWQLCCLSSCTLSFGSCVVCPLVLYLLAIVLSVLLYFIFWQLCCLFFFCWPLCCLFFFCWPLCCLFFLDLQILITSLVSANSYLLAIMLSVLLRFTDSDYLFGICKLLSFGHYVVCSS